MDTEKYRILLHTIQAGNLTKAAETCDYTVSGISRLIASLEAEQGFPLLYRNRDGVTPTPECEKLLPHIEKLVYQAEIIREVGDEVRGLTTGEIHIGIAYSSYYSRILRETNTFRQQHPDVSFTFTTGYSSELLEKVKHHELDLAIISKREKMERWIPLGEEEIVMWIPAGHELAARKEVTLEDVERYPYIDIYPGKDIDNHRICREQGIQPQIVTSAEDSYSVYQMVEAGLGISLNHRSSCENWKGAVVVRTLSPQVLLPVGIAACEDLSPVMETFLELCDTISVNNMKIC